MTRIALTLIAAAALVLAFDALVPRLLERPWLAAEEFTQSGASLAAPARLRDLLSDARLQVERARRRFEEVPDAKPDDELRIALVGNSAALFTIDANVVGESLAQRFPSRDVRIVSLMLPLIRTPDERILLRAALGKQPDVVVMTPALKGLHEADSFLSEDLRRAFPGASGADAPSGAVSRLQGWLGARLNLARSSGELRAVLLRRFRTFFQPGADAESVAKMEAGFEAIADAARRGDQRALFAAYDEHEMTFLLREEHFQRRLPREAPAFAALGQTAAAFDGSAIGLAIFMPINPMFRRDAPLPGYDAYHLDDRYAKRLADHALSIYAEAGFVAVDRMDWLPAEAFFDLVHVHGEAVRGFSLETARLIAEALSQDAPERR